MNNRHYDPYAAGLKVGGISRDEYLVICPYHNDSHPSACFNPINGMFFCFSCGAAADIYRLVKTTGGRVAFSAGNKLKSHKNKELEWKVILNSALAEDNPYLIGRGVDNQTVKTWGIRALPGAIAIPVTNHRGMEVGVIIRREQGNPRYMFFGEKPAVWPLGWLMKQKPGSDIFVTEGIFGRLAAARAGVPSVATMGALVQEDIGKYLHRFNVHVLFDNDFSGYAGAGRILSLLPSARVIVPGMEADELDSETWQYVAENGFTTRSISHLARLSKDSSKFYRQLPRTRTNKWIP